MPFDKPTTREDKIETTSEARKMINIVTKSTEDWIINNGNSITSDELYRFFWDTFMKLKSIKDKPKIVSVYTK